MYLTLTHEVCDILVGLNWFNKCGLYDSLRTHEAKKFSEL